MAIMERAIKSGYSNQMTNEHRVKKKNQHNRNRFRRENVQRRRAQLQICVSNIINWTAQNAQIIEMVERV